MKGKIAWLIPLAFILAACGAKAAPVGSPTAGVPAPASTTASGEVDISISNYAFAPDNLTVAVGTTVKWTNQDDVIHTVEAADGSWGSRDLNQGDSFSYTFTQAGTFSYRCTQHPLMKGTIVVTP